WKAAGQQLQKPQRHLALVGLAELPEGVSSQQSAMPQRIVAVWAGRKQTRDVLVRLDERPRALEQGSGGGAGLARVDLHAQGGLPSFRLAQQLRGVRSLGEARC